MNAQQVQSLVAVTSTISDLFTIAASGIAIYLFATKRQAILSAIRVLLNYSSQLTLSDLTVKLDRLNELTADDPQQRDDVANILNEILGQIRGNKALRRHCGTTLDELEKVAENPKRYLNERKKRSLVSEIRELLRYMTVEDYRDLIGEKK